jgi:hypothetical protein
MYEWQFRKNITMAALEAASQSLRVRCGERLNQRADVRWLGGRVTPDQVRGRPW